PRQTKRPTTSHASTPLITSRFIIASPCGISLAAKQPGQLYWPAITKALPESGPTITTGSRACRDEPSEGAEERREGRHETTVNRCGAISRRRSEDQDQGAGAAALLPALDGWPAPATARVPRPRTRQKFPHSWPRAQPWRCAHNRCAPPATGQRPSL